jgi:serine phosphatase RsbU (regulator of sigma subunit)
MEQSTEDFGLERVQQLFQAAPASDSAELCAFILRSVGEFGGGAPAFDDRTALTLVRTA